MIFYIRDILAVKEAYRTGGFFLSMKYTISIAELQRLRRQFEELKQTKRFSTWLDTQREKQDGRCFYCPDLLFCVIDPEQSDTKFWQHHTDHLLALAAGGTNDFANLVLACPPCNVKKGARLDNRALLHLSIDDTTRAYNLDLLAQMRGALV